MNTATNYAALYLADISKNQQELENVTREYPVSSVARFLFLYQLKKNNDPRFIEVAKQTGIYLQNPYWMEFQLPESSMANGNDSENNLVISPETIEKRAADETILQPVDVGIENFRSQIESNDHEPLPDQTFEESSLLPVEENIMDTELPQPVNEEIIENSVLENEFPGDQNIEEDRKQEIIVSNENEVEEIAEKQNDEEFLEPVNEEIAENPVLENQDLIDQNIEEEKKEKPIVSNKNAVEEFVEKQSDEESSQPVNEQITENPVLENQDIIDQNINEEKKEEPIVSNEEEEEEDHDEIPFEPLHTVDYFASQGIKLNQEALINDQLGMQVKSFTAWLKSMKKLHPGQLPEQNEVIEKLIQTSSEVSNQNANVLTEAMADVLVKQGKSEKAIEMYQKLSLINPSKSAYFAAKIESLKVN